MRKDLGTPKGMQETVDRALGPYASEPFRRETFDLVADQLKQKFTTAIILNPEQEPLLLELLKNLIGEVA